jgi:phosphoribosylaminoimidazole-succinocarboxamide synthase
MLAESFVRSGKVRDLYALGADRLLLVASDRISAFDVVMPNPVPDKGRVLTGLSRFWFARTTDIVPNHLVSTDPADLPPSFAPDDEARAELRGRMMLGHRAEVLPIECVARGYLAGSGLKDYRATGAIGGVKLPPGLRDGDRLPEPIFTPATKAPDGEHDENVDFDTVIETIGEALAEEVRALTLALYRRGAEVAERAGILLADTKFEFGVDELTDQLLLIDEVMTPDSSRFWELAAWRPGGPQPSYDKQFVRDWLEQRPWDKTAPGPVLPPDVIDGTRERYVAAFERITGGSFQRYLDEDVIAP